MHRYSIHRLVHVFYTQTCEYHIDIVGQCLDRFDSYQKDQTELIQS